MKCPICKMEDVYVKFVFVEQVQKEKVTTFNPTDYHFLYLCPNLHVYDNEGKEVKADWYDRK